MRNHSSNSMCAFHLPCGSAHSDNTAISGLSQPKASLPAGENIHNLTIEYGPIGGQIKCDNVVSNIFKPHNNFCKPGGLAVVICSSFLHERPCDWLFSASRLICSIFSINFMPLANSQTVCEEMTRAIKWANLIPQHATPYHA